MPWYNPFEDTGVGPQDIGKPINIDPLGSLESRPKFKSRKQREKAERYAEALERDATSTAPLGHWTQALAQVGKGILGGLEERDIDKDEAARRNYMASALEGKMSPEDLMKQGALYDMPEVSEIGQYQERRADRQADVDWRQQQYETGQDWKRKEFDLQQEEFDWKKTQGPEGSVPKVTDVTAMRKEIQDMDSARRYSSAIPVYNSMVQAGPNKAGDLNIVYGLAKIMDPTSVVREGEQVMVSKTADIPNWLRGQIEALNGGAVLAPETRANIMKEAKTRADAYKTDYEANLAPYLEIADYYKIDKRLIIPEYQPYTIDPEEQYGGG